MSVFFGDMVAHTDDRACGFRSTCMHTEATATTIGMGPIQRPILYQTLPRSNHFVGRLPPSVGPSALPET